MREEKYNIKGWIKKLVRKEVERERRLKIMTKGVCDFPQESF
jgi:hypothetical protein